MTIKQIQLWFACAMPGTRSAWQFILFARTQAQEYVFEFELRDAYEITPQTSYPPTFEIFLASAGLQVTTEDIPPFGQVEIVYINKPYVDLVGSAVTDPDYSDACRVYGFNGTPYPSA